MDSIHETHIDEPELQVFLEHAPGLCIFHLGRVVFSRRTLRRMQRECHRLQQHCGAGAHVYCAFPQHDPKLHRLMKHLPMEYLADDGEYSIYTYRKETECPKS